jgi:hypothetical protein
MLLHQASKEKFQVDTFQAHILVMVPPSGLDRALGLVHTVQALALTLDMVLDLDKAMDLDQVLDLGLAKAPATVLVQDPALALALARARVQVQAQARAQALHALSRTSRELQLPRVAQTASQAKTRRRRALEHLL